MGSWTTVVDVAKQMELVYCQSLYHLSKSYYEIVGTACRDNGIDNNVDIGCLVGVFRAFMQQFLNDLRKVGRQ